MQIKTAGIKDCAEILDLQRLAYRQEAEIYNDFSIQPLMQTLDEIKKEFGSRTVLIAITDYKIVGSVRAYEGNDTCYIGKLIVHPEYQNRGIGFRLMKEIEGKFNTAKRYELFTGDRNEKNLYIYKKLGYKIIRQEKVSDKVNIVYLEKANEKKNN